MIDGHYKRQIREEKEANETLHKIVSNRLALKKMIHNIMSQF